MSWTQQLGNAVLEQRSDVMDAVQRMRQQAYDYGYLRDPQFTQYQRVQFSAQVTLKFFRRIPATTTCRTITPWSSIRGLVPDLWPRGVFRFGPRIAIGASFAPFGWGGVGFGWREHNILIDLRPWGGRGPITPRMCIPMSRPITESRDRNRTSRTRPSTHDHGDRGMTITTTVIETTTTDQH